MWMLGTSINFELGHQPFGKAGVLRHHSPNRIANELIGMTFHDLLCWPFLQTTRETGVGARKLLIPLLARKLDLG